MTTNTLWNIIRSIMSATALATLGAGLLFVATSLYTAGFIIQNLGYFGGSIGAWVGATISVLFGLWTLLVPFRKEYNKQKKRDEWDDSSKDIKST